MTDERTLEMLRLLLEHREWDEVSERWLIDYDELVRFLLGIPPEPIELDPAMSYRIVDVPVIDGVATLPDGRTVVSSGNVVHVPIPNFSPPRCEREGPMSTMYCGDNCNHTGTRHPHPLDVPGAAYDWAMNTDRKARWQRFRRWEDGAARRGSGLTREQMIGAKLYHDWLKEDGP